MKKVPFSAQRPSQAPIAASVDDWIERRDISVPEATKRFTIDVPVSLHKRIKTQCAIEGIHMAEEIRKLLEQRFPPKATLS
jgi:hypothetical protein